MILGWLQKLLSKVFCVSHLYPLKPEEPLGLGAHLSFQHLGGLCVCHEKQEAFDAPVPSCLSSAPLGEAAAKVSASGPPRCVVLVPLDQLPFW